MLKLLFVVPAPAKLCLAVFNDPPVAQAPRVTTFHSSVVCYNTVVNPPNAKAAVFVPPPAKYLLAVFKLFTSVQLVPFQVSVFPTGTVEAPPNPSAAVLSSCSCYTISCSI
jgi:hypothetical protein